MRLRWAVTVLAGVALVLSVTNGVFGRLNTKLMATVTGQQHFLSDTATIRRIDEALIRSLADGAAKGDTKLKDVLAASGIRVVGASGDSATGASETGGSNVRPGK